MALGGREVEGGALVVVRLVDRPALPDQLFDNVEVAPARRNPASRVGLRQRCTYSNVIGTPELNVNAALKPTSTVHLTERQRSTHRRPPRRQSRLARPAF